ncbi:hypothetical protein EFV37_25200 [Mesorhizobium loti]|uniref:Uncharacterized protein n=1 Tax=Mesorhizobium jarvisii TaxID=1777867 RepID=A0A6M7TPM0_9HYPH|nr:MULTISPECIES: hypothetical protein [Mesorhizobium]OBQ68384.1 hypothetical protein A9K72_09015 [Mesorhizobium loti]QKC65197.1 hypothetical protein EB229_25195 [Mesorhizobium jarvisii]QKD11112.1 hypothetical protein EFV37_25200 [Mesorhizobium loti]RJT31082.1 hypothetical protein D3242_22740 [Mesorhizobium jarvisii]
MIKTRLACPHLADRGARLAGVGFTDRLVPRQVGAADYEFPAAPVPQEPDRAVAAAEASHLKASAAFSCFTESCPVAHPSGQDSAPAVAASSAGALSHTSNAVLLRDHVMVLVRAIAAYERCTNERAVALALTEYATAIGAGVLARAVADLGDELADVPAHARLAANRFRSGGP